MSKPKQDTFLQGNSKPDHECRSCDNWVLKENNNGCIDYAAGSCPATGLSCCPARHVCSSWSKKRKEDEE